MKSTIVEASIARRRALLAQIYLGANGQLRLEDAAEQLLQDHGITVSVPTLSRDVAALKAQWRQMSSLTTAQVCAKLLSELEAHKAFIVSRGSEHPDYSDDFLKTVSLLVKLVAGPESANAQAGRRLDQLSDAEIVAKMLEGLTPAQSDQVHSLLQKFQAENEAARASEPDRYLTLNGHVFDTVAHAEREAEILDAVGAEDA